MTQFTRNGEYTDVEVANVIKAVLEKVCKEHNSDPNTTSLKKQMSGCYTIEANGESKYFFFDEFELAAWIQEYLEND